MRSCRRGCRLPWRAWRRRPATAGRSSGCRPRGGRWRRSTTEGGRRGRLALPGRQARELDAAAEGVADRRPVSGAEGRDAVLEEAAVGRRRGDDDRVVGKGDEADLHAARHVIRKGGNRGPRCFEPARSNVRRDHRVRRIDHQHHRRPVGVVSIGTRGRATATQSSATAPSSRPAIRWRRQFERVATEASTARFGNEIARTRRPSLEPQVPGERKERQRPASRADTGRRSSSSYLTLAQTARTCTSACVPAAAVAVTRAMTARPAVERRTFTAPRCNSDGEAAWRNAIAELAPRSCAESGTRGAHGLRRAANRRVDDDAEQRLRRLDRRPCRPSGPVRRHPRWGCSRGTAGSSRSRPWEERGRHGRRRYGVSSRRDRPDCPSRLGTRRRRRPSPPGHRCRRRRSP